MSREEERGRDPAIVGRWIAVGSELPCLVVALLFAGQLVAGQIGALVGALSGFVLGVIGIYATIRLYEQIEENARKRPAYMPSEEEILEDIQFPLEKDDES